MTRRQWFETLPTAYAERAIRNTTPARDLDEECRCLATAIGGGFIWNETPEGAGFWVAVHQGELPPIPGEEPAPEPAPEYPEPPAGFAVVMGPLARLATEYEQRDIAGRMGGGWSGQGLSSTYSSWTGCDEGFPYALRIGSQLAIDNGLSGIPDTQPAPAYRYYRSRVSSLVWRFSDTGGECRDQPGSPWVSSCFRDEDHLVRMRNPNPCDEQGNLNPPGGFNCDLVEEITPTTVEEWLHTIPESEAALRNMESQRDGWYYQPGTVVDNAYDAVGRSFSWGDSPEGYDYWQEVHRRLLDEYRSGVHPATTRSTPATHPANRARATTPTPPTPPPAPKVKYRITEVRHYFLEAEDEIEADNILRDARDPAREFRMHIEDREIHNDA